MFQYETHASFFERDTSHLLQILIRPAEEAQLKNVFGSPVKTNPPNKHKPSSAPSKVSMNIQVYFLMQTMYGNRAGKQLLFYHYKLLL